MDESLKNKSRIYGKPVKIDTKKVNAFFENRGMSYDPDNPYVSILYQDNNPEIASNRDIYEKTKIIPLLGIEKRRSVFDVGCGVGRWADALASHIDRYVGIDFSKQLIDIARSRHTSKKIEFLVHPAEKINSAQLLNKGPFDIVLMAGILIYLNDQQVLDCLSGLTDLISPECCIYFREPIALEERLTLNSYWSNELSYEYNAIYRTLEQTTHLIDSVLSTAGFQKSLFKPLYKEQPLNNRKETLQHYCVLTRDKV